MLMRQSNFPTLFNDATTNTNRRFSELLDEIMDDAFSLNRGRFVPELNVYETDKEFEVTLALPGMGKDDIALNLENHTLTISGERKFEEENGRKYHRVESRFGEFERSLPLPDIIDQEGVKATFENGVLTVTIPKQEEKAGRKIEVS